MIGVIRRLEEPGYLTSERAEPYAVYEWRPAGWLRSGSFRLRLFSPEGLTPRRFFIEPVVRNWFGGRPGPFLAQACRVGWRFLCELHPSTAPGQRQFRFWDALFRNRLAGHVAVRRQFKAPLDFASLSACGGPTLITPGLEATVPPRTYSHAPGQLAYSLLCQALRDNGVPPPADRVRSGDVIRFYQQQVGDGGAAGRRGPDDCDELLGGMEEILGRSTLDRLFTGGRNRSLPWNGKQAVNSVSSALLYGKTPLSEQIHQASEDAEGVERLIARLGRNLDLSSSVFDRRLRDAREHGFVTGRPVTDREQAAERARGHYRVLLWFAHQGMARCFGGLMGAMHMTLCMRGGLPDFTEEERWLFREMHYPQPYLAGLPLAFFPREPVRWIWAAMRTLWNRLEYDGAAYDACTRLLGLFGLLVSERRREDAAAKGDRA